MRFSCTVRHDFSFNTWNSRKRQNKGLAEVDDVSQTSSNHGLEDLSLNSPTLLPDLDCVATTESGTFFDELRTHLSRLENNVGPLSKNRAEGVASSRAEPEIQTFVTHFTSTKLTYHC